MKKIIKITRNIGKQIALEKSRIKKSEVKTNLHSTKLIEINLVFRLQVGKTEMA